MKPILAGLAGLAVVAALVAVPFLGGEEPAPDRLRVGTFDSRAIAIAYAASAHNEAFLKELRDRHEKAKAAGDEEAVERIAEEARARQRRFHRMGFGTESVLELLAAVKDAIPAVAEKAEVDLIVSKWELVHRSGGAELVDVTLPLVNLFDPSEKTLGHVREIAEHPPVSREELEKHEHE